MPSNNYYTQDTLIKNPGQLGATGAISKKTQLKENSYAIKDYHNIITGENDYAVKRNDDPDENIKQIGERKFIELPNLQCKDHGASDTLVGRYLYFDHRPPVTDGGLLGGLKQNMNMLDATKNSELILKNLKETPSKSKASVPYCRDVTCQVVGDINSDSTHPVAYEDMPYNELPNKCEETDPNLKPPGCNSYTTIKDTLGSDTSDSVNKLAKYEYYRTTRGETFTNIKTKVDTDKLPKDKMIQGYYCLLSFLGFYLIYSCSTLKPNR
jgi:hypothetical protein